MKVLAMLGSPRKESASSRLAREVLRGASDAGHTVRAYTLNEMEVRGCQGCLECKNRNVDCVLDDDLQAYWQELRECDALIVSAPNYAGTVNGPMITYMNRHYCLLDADWNVRLQPGIKLMGIFSQGKPDRHFYDAEYAWYLNDFEHRDMQLVKTMVHLSSETLRPGEGLMQEAYAIGNGLKPE